MSRSFDDDWRRWIAENLLLDVPPETLAVALASHGFAPADATHEVDAALASPYLQGGARLRNRLRKRDWMLSVYRTLARMRAAPQTNAGAADAGVSATAVERRERLSRDEFFESYYCQNRPVLIDGMLDAWPALRKWGYDYFRARCGDAEVEVQFGRESDENYEINQPKHKRLMCFRDYVDLVEQSGATNDFYMTANNTSRNRAALAALWDDIPPIDTYLDASSPDKGFFWFGPAGTKTPFHHDLTNNFMAQVMGRKLVRLVPLADTPFMYNHFHCFSQVDGSAIDTERFPAMKNAQVVECTLGPGELLFLPIGWWHYVEGLDVSVTMTFTNFLRHNDFASAYGTYHEL